MTNLELWNVAAEAEAEAALLACCGAVAWAHALVGERPYATTSGLLQDAEAAWFQLPEEDWLAAFACHPRIGERKAVVPTTAGFARASVAEQSAAQPTLETVASELAEGNRAYEQCFGFLYIVFADGCTAGELLANLKERLRNDRAAEVEEAARQQWLITKLRMSRWLA